MTSISNLKRMQQLTWVLIYGGLLTMVLGVSVRRTDDALGWTLLAVGAVVALAGFALVLMRARMKAD